MNRLLLVLSILSISLSAIGQEKILLGGIGSFEKGCDSQKWKEWKDMLTAKPGQDGYLTLMYPDSFTGQPERYSCNSYYYINGMQTSFTKAIYDAKRIAEILQEEVKSIYSESSVEQSKKAISVTNDLVIALGIPAVNEAEHILFATVLLDLELGKKVTIFAHSRGAAILYRHIKREADFRQLRPYNEYDAKYDKLLKNLTIVTFGGYSPDNPDKWKTTANVKIYNHPQDPVPMLWNLGKLGEFDLSYHDFRENYLPFISQFKNR